MKAIGILLIGAATLLAGCACDCADGVGTTANGMPTPDNIWRKNEGNGISQDTSDRDTNGTSRGEITTDTTKSTGRSATSATDPNYNKKTKDDPRTYGTTSGGVGYRNDTIDAYDGIDGTARDKDHGGISPR